VDFIEERERSTIREDREKENDRRNRRYGIEGRGVGRREAKISGIFWRGIDEASGGRLAISL